MTSNPSNVAAFFDLDRTLIEVNSGAYYAFYEWRNGEITHRQFLKSILWMALYHFSLIDMEKAFDQAVRHYEGLPERELRQRTEDFFHQYVTSAIQPGALHALQSHRQQGHPLVLLTASSTYLSECVAQHWDLDAILANHFPTDDQGHLLGEFEDPFCYGEGKVHRARRWAEEANVDLSRSYFYSDSLSDLPMLEVVDNPRIVNPDPRLQRVAQRRGWPILDWTKAQ